MTRTIPSQEISFLDLSVVDDLGKVFSWQGRIFRAIRPESVDGVKDLFDRGVMKELISRGLFIDSWISDHVIEGSPLLVEHKAVPIVVYPYEWSFSMLQDAALLVLEMNQVLREHGLQTRDAHGYNVVFDQASPRFVDLGSIVPLAPGSRGWLAEEEFARYYFYALKLWSASDAEFGRSVLGTAGRLMSHGAYLRHRYRLLRGMSSGTLHRIGRYYYKFRTLSFPETQQLVSARLPDWRERTLLALQKRHLLPLQSVSLKGWHRKVRHLAPPRDRSEWANYQSELQKGEGGLRSTPRFDRIMLLMKELGVESMVELGGNQGAFARLAAQKLDLKDIICTDFDGNAVDVLYRSIRNAKTPITPAVIDCMFPTVTCLTPAPWARFRRDAVVALAISHHLILAQKLPLERVLQRLAEYSSRYAFIEFMPLGLWDGAASPPVPSWYTEEWFANGFAKRFKVLFREKLEANRILFVGERTS